MRKVISWPQLIGENNVMRYDARHTMTYKAGDLLDEASLQKA